MNLKRGYITQQELGFNRYMVECEYSSAIVTLSFPLVLIDTWWNVNINFSGKMAQMTTVLIDTWWNVNVSALKKPLGNGTVLIDTWWNVNKRRFASLYVVN